MDQQRVAEMAGEVTELQNIEDCRAMPGEAQWFVAGRCFALGRYHQLHPGAIHFTDFGQVDLDFRLCLEGVEQLLTQRRRREDAYSLVGK